MLREAISNLPPTVQSHFYNWSDFLHKRVIFNMPDSFFHGPLHCVRVLLYALIMGELLMKNDAQALTILAHAAVFHDSRRQDEWADTGHGARAAEYYAEFCQKAGNEDIPYQPESACLMHFHDLNDEKGYAHIDKYFAGDAGRARLLFSIFKDADALDRLRFGDYSLKVSYLRTPEAVSLIQFARNLVNLTQRL
ncbi:MAG: HD domain-containing protein [Akkermansia sp.]|nr:HD domain-containing protein [Akkermansia sp.]